MQIQLATFDLSPEVLEAIETGNPLRDRPAAVPAGLPGRPHPHPVRPTASARGGHPILTGPGFVTQENAATVIRSSPRGHPLASSWGRPARGGPSVLIAEERFMATASAQPADERVRSQGLTRVLLNRPELGAVAGAIVVWIFFAIVAGDSGFLTLHGTANYLEVAAQLGILGRPWRC